MRPGAGGGARRPDLHSWVTPPPLCHFCHLALFFRPWNNWSFPPSTLPGSLAVGFIIWSRSGVVRRTKSGQDLENWIMGNGPPPALCCSEFGNSATSERSKRSDAIRGILWVHCRSTAGHHVTKHSGMFERCIQALLDFSIGCVKAQFANYR